VFAYIEGNPKNWKALEPYTLAVGTSLNPRNTSLARVFCCRIWSF